VPRFVCSETCLGRASLGLGLGFLWLFGGLAVVVTAMLLHGLKNGRCPGGFHGDRPNQILLVDDVPVLPIRADWFAERFQNACHPVPRPRQHFETWSAVAAFSVPVEASAIALPDKKLIRKIASNRSN